jgi:hypothetical protein
LLNKLPRELRVLLVEADIANKRVLCTRADSFAAHNSKMSHDVGAAFLSRIVKGRELHGGGSPGAGSSQSGSGSGQQGGASQPGSKKSRRGGGSGSGQQVTYTVSHTKWDQASAFPTNMLIDPSGQALLDSAGRRLAGLAQPSPPTATVVVGFVQPYSPTPAVSSMAHVAGPAIAKAALSSAHTAGPASKMKPAEVKAAYSRLLKEFPSVVCSSK